MRLEDLGLIGNCQYSALVHNSGEIVWCCLPRFDSEPVCSTLLDSQGGGHFRIGPANRETGIQRCLPNTNILETTFRTATGRREEARTMFDQMRRALSPLGLLSEDYDPSGLRMWGNFPQTYSHVGLIHAAFAASPRWAEVW